MPKRQSPPVIHDWDMMPVTLDLKYLAAIFHLSEKTIRRKVSQGTFEPRPFHKRPLLWRKAVVRKYVEDFAVDLVTQ